MTDEEILEKNKIYIEKDIANYIKEYNFQTEVDINRFTAKYQSNFIKGFKEGREEVIHQKNMEIVSRMLKENMDIKFISSVTGLSHDEILQIQNKL